MTRKFLHSRSCPNMPWPKMFVTRMLTRDLFAVADLVYYRFRHFISSYKEKHSVECISPTSSDDDKARKYPVCRGGSGRHFNVERYMIVYKMRWLFGNFTRVARGRWLSNRTVIRWNQMKFINIQQEYIESTQVRYTCAYFCTGPIVWNSLRE